MDQLSISWELAATVIEAKSTEAKEMGGRCIYPLNLQGNYRPELVRFRQHLAFTRAAYKLRHLALAE
jgi:hypothetical protein